MRLTQQLFTKRISLVRSLSKKTQGLKCLVKTQAKETKIKK